MKKKVVSVLLATTMVAGLFAGCGEAKKGGNSTGAGTEGGSDVTADTADEGKVINIYSWNDEARERICAVYDRVVETSEDGTVTKLDDGTEIHWIVNPN
ncbi:MAG: carbohydrate ABC transporter substrate-binding protein, partial [Agathobacter sp.]|nr:carbohydrate ABC transporter substrate-binding protein [Agathobacter sp.]